MYRFVLFLKLTSLLDYEKIYHLGTYFVINLSLSLPHFCNYTAYTGYVHFSNKTPKGINYGACIIIISKFGISKEGRYGRKNSLVGLD